MSDGRDVSDDELEALTSSLTQHQAEAVKRRVNTLSTTMRKKKGAGKMHVKDIFPTPDNSSPVCSTPLCVFYPVLWNLIDWREKREMEGKSGGINPEAES